MQKLRLSRGKFALVDDADYEVVSAWKWSYGTNGYAFRQETVNGNRAPVLLHRVLMNPLGKEVVDHISGDKLDNRRQNLRLVDRKLNVRNKYKCNSKSGHIGVYWSNQNKKWNAQIGIDGKSTSLGFFDDLNEALRTRIKAEIKHWGFSNRVELL